MPPRKHLKLWHQGLIIIALPLVFELLSSGVLFVLLTEAEARTQAEARSKAILSQIDNIAVSSLTMSTMSAKELFPLQTGKLSTNRKFFYQNYEQMIRQVRDQIAELRTMQTEQSRVDGIEAAANVWMSQLQICRDIIKRDGAYRFLVLDASRRNELLNSFDRLIERLNEFRAMEKTKGSANPNKARKLKELLKGVLKISIFINIALSLLLAWFFNKKLAGRFEILLENCRRMESGRPLKTRMTEGDELASLDSSLHKANEEITARQERLQSLLQNMFVGLVTLDSRGEILSVNDRIIEMYGFHPDELIGQPILRLLAGSEKRKEKDFAAICAESLGAVTEMVTTKKDGTALPVDFCLDTYEIQGSKLFIANFLDVSDRNKYEQIKKQFLSVVSHEIKTPITSIRLFIDYLLSGDYGKLSDKGRQRAESAKSNAEKIITLINDLLRIEKMRTGKLEMFIERVSVDQLIERSIESVADIARLKDIGITSEKTGLMVNADAKWLVQVMVNFLANAINSSSHGQAISIKASFENLWVTVSVIDEGCGIAEDHLDLIFDPFFQSRMKGGAKSNYEGTGLGLTVCKSIIEQLHGTVGVRSAIGEGSTFWFQLPGADPLDHSAVSASEAESLNND